MPRVLAILVLASLPAAAEVLRDPTAPPLAPQTSTASIAQTRPHLTSVLIAADRRVAVIDGRTLVEGESAAGLTLLAVRPNGVTVRVNGVALDLHLDGEHMIKERSLP